MVCIASLGPKLRSCDAPIERIHAVSCGRSVELIHWMSLLIKSSELKFYVT